MVSPRLDTTFAHLAIEFLETGDGELLQRIARTPAACFLEAHSRRVSRSGDGPDAGELVVQLLTSSTMSDVDQEGIRIRLSLMQTESEAYLRCWNESAAYLPSGALSGAVLYLTVGYDIGVAMDGQASLNLAHQHFASNPGELLFYAIHELHHVGFQKYNPLPIMTDIRTTSDLANLIRCLTAMEGQAVHAVRRWRTEAGAMETDSDYVALLDPQRMAVYEKEFFRLYRSLAEVDPRPLEGKDWGILERMSAGDRLWYRVGALIADRIERELGRQVLIKTIVQGPEAFFGRYAELSAKSWDDPGKLE